MRFVLASYFFGPPTRTRCRVPAGAVLQLPRRSPVGAARVMAALVTLAMLGDASPTVAGSEPQYGVFLCNVEKYYGDYFLGRTWLHAQLIYDADAGTLDGSFDPTGELRPKGLAPEFKLMFSHLPVQTPPSSVNNLNAAQYVPAATPSHRPIIAWLMLETLQDSEDPPFQFLSNSIRGLVTGRCHRKR